MESILVNMFQDSQVNPTTPLATKEKNSVQILGEKQLRKKEKKDERSRNAILPFGLVLRKHFKYAGCEFNQLGGPYPF